MFPARHVVNKKVFSLSPARSIIALYMATARTKAIVSRVTTGEHKTIKIRAAKLDVSIDTYVRLALRSFHTASEALVRSRQKAGDESRVRTSDTVA